MADITPTPPVIPPLAQTTAPPAVFPTSLLPVQILDLPDALLHVQQQISLTGALQVAAENHLALSTTLGKILFDLPLLRNNPLLLQQLLPFIESGKTVQLHLAASPDGVLHGNLILSATTPLSTTPQQPSGSSIPNLLGKEVAVLILSQDPETPASTAFPAYSLQNAPPAPALSRLAQQFLHLLTGASQSQNAGASSDLVPSPPQLNQGMNLKIQNFVAPGQTPPELAADEFVATVTGYSTPLQNPVLQAGNTSIMLKTSMPLQIGGMVVLKLPQPQAAEIPDASDLNKSTWPILEQLVARPQVTDPVPLQQFVQNRMPQMNQAMGGAMLFMLAAFNRGDARQWLGRDMVESLEQAGKKNLVTALQEEMRESMSTTTDPVVGQWRVYHLPYLTQGQLAPLHIYVHHDGENGEKGEPGKKPGHKTRFVIDVTFTRLGAMQFDGFVQKTKFDLLLRSERILDPGLRHELRFAFTEAVGAVGYTGQLMFQQGSQGWMRFPQNKHEVLQA
ncbi:MAG: hypothetical protein WBK91_04790 [Alphaproteobacteria bacterium]